MKARWLKGQRECQWNRTAMGGGWGEGPGEGASIETAALKHAHYAKTESQWECAV